MVNDPTSTTEGERRQVSQRGLVELATPLLPFPSEFIRPSLF